VARDDLARGADEAVPVRDADEGPVAAAVARQVEGDRGEGARVAQGLGKQREEEVAMIAEAVDEHDDRPHRAGPRGPGLVEDVLAALQGEEGAGVVQLPRGRDLVQRVAWEVLPRHVDIGRRELPALLARLLVGELRKGARPGGAGKPRQCRRADGPGDCRDGGHGLGLHAVAREGLTTRKGPAAR